ncbi:tryptophan halogenase family protein [Microbulbifer hydrolyticus]|uniref:Tryptophan halogenase n=1 Tax=Microbulbifer hydrolyticus TaxID=48074 RepID=A0A6P1TBW4_9GAMM|nr:tryptophan halogenase family protein [Microbulbifer hydrolyticus]MBB5212657.1 tryptophan halogenase [Microbulbifer hydrolyticus]QHQ40258.1 tryptophan halogenase [Microbulbifer hydrolyticus]
MKSTTIRNLVILGGGTAGWMTAALMAKVLGRVVSITLVESDQIGTVGVGEATIPPIQNFNRALGLDEREFLQATKGTIKLGIQFENWSRQGTQYMHAFGGIGKNFPFCDFYNYWLRARAAGDTSSLWDYSLNCQAALANRFAPLNQIPNTNLPGISYAYHFDAGLYAQFLRRYAEEKGVKRIEGKVCDVASNSDSGFVENLKLESGDIVEGDLFVDCSGFVGLLIDKVVGSEYEQWGQWLPCDRAMAVPSKSAERIAPYTRSIAHTCGWQWQIPLQHRTGNGLVYSSSHWSDEQAQDVLFGNLPGEPLAEPRIIPFKTGHRPEQWKKNVVSLGLASGFLEPLESTSIHLVQSAATRLIKCFPHRGIREQEVAEFNRQSRVEMERIRDFIILHYKANQRRDSDFWRDCEEMVVPDSLQEKIDLFRSTGKVFRDYDDLFTEVAWQQVLIGQGVLPEDHHVIAEGLSEGQLKDLLQSLKTLVQGTVAQMPSHEAFLSGRMH